MSSQICDVKVTFVEQFASVSLQFASSPTCRKNFEKAPETKALFVTKNKKSLNPKNNLK